MKRLYHIGLCVLLITALTSCNGQTKSNNQTQPNSVTTKNKVVAGGCGGCEIMFVGTPTNINSVDTQYPGISSSLQKF